MCIRYRLAVPCICRELCVQMLCGLIHLSISFTIWGQTKVLVLLGMIGKCGKKNKK